MRMADSGCSPLKRAECLLRLQLATSGLSTDDSRSGNLLLGSWFSLIQPYLIGQGQLGLGPCSTDEGGSFATELVSIGHELRMDLT
jgi:hypothetical protein